MRKLAFGYSTRCNIRCAHCVATGDLPADRQMDHAMAKEDDQYEQFLRNHGLTFFPEPVIYAGRAESFKRRRILTDYQANCCDMNPYLTPDLDIYACFDAGTHFPVPPE